MQRDARGLRRIPGRCVLLIDAIQSRLATRVPSSNRPIPPDLRRELDSPPEWMYPWELAPGVVAPIHRDHLTAIHETRLAMMEPAVKEALLAASPDGTVIDLACNEGWFSHRALDLGAVRAVGIDIRDVNVRRAGLVAEQLGIPAEQIEFRQADVYDLDPDELGQFDVVLLLGLIYHVEDPTGAIRMARRLAKRLCVIETQLTRQDEPVEWGRGRGHIALAAPSFAGFYEEDASENPVASAPGILSLIPNRAAVAEMARASGFRLVEEVPPPVNAQQQFIDGDRGLFLAWV
jgi:tRNA (mo5U34)-methyltransferase